MVGKTLGHYEILEPLGAGGMGEVYRARDTNLDRDVAIKVLPEDFATDQDRLDRFEREAKLLAVLNHPNIGAIYGLEEAEGTRFLALELIEGVTLAEMLASQSPTVEETLRVARQIADALEAAHGKGIVHRDFKPGNVQITPEGQVKVLDFGLAKGQRGDAAGAVISRDITESPTMPEATGAGIVLGTAAYMSPEQARGKPVDKRADIWAFGAVLYEMFTGRKPFEGGTVTDIMAAIIEREPDWSSVPDNVPPTIQLLMRRCLEKDTYRRLHDIADARIEIVHAINEPDAGLPGVAARGADATPWKLATAAMTVVALAALAFAVWGPGRVSLNEPGAVTRVSIPMALGEGVVSNFVRNELAISRDGTTVVYSAAYTVAVDTQDDLTDQSVTQLFVRRLDELVARPIPGTEGATGPFFSPDGQWVGFFANLELRRVALSGGAPLKVCDAQNVRGASWGEDDTIIFTPAQDMGLWRVPAAGGIPVEVTAPDREAREKSHRFPQILPGGDSVLFTVATVDITTFDEARVEVVSLATGDRRLVLEAATHATYLPTGHLVYMRAGQLTAVAFDIDRMEPSGQPVSVVSDVSYSPIFGAGQIAFAESGAMAYLPGEQLLPNVTMMWVGRDGTSQPISEEERFFQTPIRTSHEGQRIVVDVGGANDSVWLYEIPRQTLTRLTFDGESDNPVWAPDGEHIAFRTRWQNHVSTIPVFGSGQEKTILTSDFDADPQDWTANGNVLLYTESHPGTSLDLWMLSLDDGGQPRPYAESRYAEVEARFSPDGRHIAYASNEGGRFDVYVQEFPEAGRKWQISTSGGRFPVWNPVGGELFYRLVDGSMMVADVETEGTFTASTPQLLFEKPGYSLEFDVAHDGDGFLMLSGIERSPETQINLVLNWFEELKERVPVEQ